VYPRSQEYSYRGQEFMGPQKGLNVEVNVLIQENVLQMRMLKSLG